MEDHPSTAFVPPEDRVSWVDEQDPAVNFDMEHQSPRPQHLDPRRDGYIPEC